MSIQSCVICVLSTPEAWFAIHAIAVADFVHGCLRIALVAPEIVAGDDVSDRGRRVCKRVMATHQLPGIAHHQAERQGTHLDLLYREDLPLPPEVAADAFVDIAASLLMELTEGATDAVH